MSKVNRGIYDRLELLLKSIEHRMKLINCVALGISNLQDFGNGPILDPMST